MTDNEYEDEKINFALRKIEEALGVNVTVTFVIYYDDASYSFPMSECTNSPTYCSFVLTN